MSENQSRGLAGIDGMPDIDTAAGEYLIPGEVLLRVRGGSETYLAWSERPLPKGAQVLVVEARAARTLDVVPWTGHTDSTE